MAYPFDLKLILEHLLVPSFGFPGAEPPRVQDGGVVLRAGGQLLALVTPLSTPATSKVLDRFRRRLQILNQHIFTDI